MTIKHHPSDGSLLCYAGGTLGSGPALALAIHLANCATCRSHVATFEALGGALLQEMPPERVDPGALSKTLSAMEKPLATLPAKVTGPVRDGDLELPSQLRHCLFGPWRWLGPGMRWKRVTLPWDSDANVVLLRVAAGRSLPWHTHVGTEFTQVLSGSFSHNLGRFLPGDMDEADGDIEHQPVVDQGSECVSLAALDGDIRIRSFLGRTLKFFVGF